MAVTVASSSAKLTNNPTTVVKPTGLAVGDLMICQLVMIGDTDVATWSTGWTLIEKKIDTNTSPDQYSELRWKIAESGDVSGSDVTIITSYSVGGTSMAHLLRITGHSPLGVITEASALEATSATPSYANTITPGSGNEDSLIIIFTNAYGASITTSGYAIATSNPSWTEQYDESNGGTSVACAFANRPQITATGNTSLTYSGSTSSICQILAVRPARTTTTSDTVTDTDSVAITSGYSTSQSDTVTDTDSTTATKGQGWTNDTKSVSSWTNKQK